MALSIGIPAETTPGERRVALVPDVAAKLQKLGFEIWVEAGAGIGAYLTDEAYTAQGARVVSRADAFAADVVVKVQPPTTEEVGLMRSGSVLIGFLSPLDQPALARELAAQGVTAISVELVPRISRAQKMDALSAMASVAPII